ncbi:uncharacterized protein MONBRDRAFT_23596 [Monosiga brevicollis MX1]|uniref:Isochorismatase-like domain-containing protein n=1 Tax=Monosiga brevicollis TaxID=81824 RepID=A9UTW9_MONBE|nr:uncharacterized protein MONBRDRAFT_23596 [Monosiga brevicollis MX1]EDQ91319.1 predicted protein [Monosiga brevicollis MX1]|eukprot:XP_001743741.1 hypothetical protein [Monosiga brevicollis MX1]
MAASTAVNTGRAIGKLGTGFTAFFLCDMQERFRDQSHHFAAVATVCNRLTAASKVMNIPLIVTEQYPKALGHTVPEIVHDHAVINVPKTKFSMVTDEVQSYLKENTHVKSALLFGIEAHVCVLQTALDLLEDGYDVHVVVDATSSRNPPERMYAFERMRQSGAFLTTAESALFQLMGDSKHEHFKEVQKLIKDLPPDSGLLAARVQ